MTRYGTKRRIAARRKSLVVAALITISLPFSAGAQDSRTFLYVADLQGNRIEAVDLSTNLLDPIRHIEVARPRGLAFSAAGDRIFVAALDTFHIFSPTGSSLLKLPLSLSAPLVGDFNFDNKTDFDDFLTFVSGFGKRQGQQGYISLLDLDADGDIDFQDFLSFASHFGDTAPDLNANRAGSKIALSANEGHVFITEEAIDRVKVIDLEMLSAVASISTGVGPSGIASSPDRSAIYAADKGRTLTVVDAERFNLRARFDLGGIGNARVAVSPDGARLYTARTPDPGDDPAGFSTIQLVAIDAVTGALLDSVTVGQSWDEFEEIPPDVPIDIRLSEDGTRLLTTLQRFIPGPTVGGAFTLVEQGGLVVLDAETFEIVDDIAVGDAVGQFMISQDGAIAYVVAIDSFTNDPFLRLFILDLQSGQKMGSIGGFVAPVEFGFQAEKSTGQRDRLLPIALF